jgi:hypothetical protein
MVEGLARRPQDYAVGHMLHLLAADRGTWLWVGGRRCILVATWVGPDWVVEDWHYTLKDCLVATSDHWQP